MELEDEEVRDLIRHYKTMYDILDTNDPDLVDLDRSVTIFHRCRVDKTVYQCEHNRRKNSSRLNHLACVILTVDKNARFKDGTRPRDMIWEYNYVFIKYFCVHHFRGILHMLLYGDLRRIDVHDGLVEDKGSRYHQFVDIVMLDHLCALVTRDGPKYFIIDEQELMEERLRTALGRS
jgi:hypothetical protein